MPARNVTITGIMVWEDPIAPPGPNDPRPSHPIMLPGMPGWGEIPGFGGPGGGRPIYPGEPGYPVRPQPQPPLGFWGPNDPRPSNPIQLPPWAGQPQPPFPVQPPLGIWGGPYFPPFWGAGNPGWRPDPDPIRPPTLPGTTPPGTATPPGEVPPHPATGVNNLYVWIPYVGMVGPIYLPPGQTTPPPTGEVPPPTGEVPPPA